ncbi:ABC-2 type transport system permease protein [Streptacidiphilus sp. MAP12-33]|uniref:ABC transporter permease n=1 Tax=Streptacidiphilus sp. MAP12-33 TaxID=3156266 RepID=UPI003517F3CA
MTALSTAPAATTAPRAEPDEPSARFRDLLAGEWFKLWSMRSMRWGYALGAIGIVWLNANSALADVQDWDHFSAAQRAGFVPGSAFADTFTNNAGITVLLVAGVLGAMSLVSEYSSGLIRVSFAAVPSRRALLGAKIAVLTAVMLAFGLVLTFTSFGLSEAILSSKHAGISLSQPGIRSGLTAAILLPVVSGLVGLGLAAVIRHSAATVVAVVSLLLLIPDFLTDQHYWSACLDHAMPFRAFQFLHDLTPYRVNPYMKYPVHPRGEWWVFLLWPLVSVVVALVLVEKRDV